MKITFIQFLTQYPLLALAVVCTVIVIIVAAYRSFMKNENGLAALLGVSVVVVLVLYTEAYSFANKSASETVVVMPNKQNLRLGEDGKLSFCINGMARNWMKTEEGVISTTARTYQGRPMRCMSVKESIVWLKNKGATNDELIQFKNAYQ